MDSNVLPLRAAPEVLDDDGELVAAGGSVVVERVAGLYNEHGFCVV